MRVRLILLSLIIVVVCSEMSSYAQGSKADYERAKNVGGLFAWKVAKEKISPQWSWDNEKILYKNEYPGHRVEFVHVDVKKGNRSPAFHYKSMAEQLGNHLGRKLETDKLPVRWITWERDRKSFILSADEHWFRYDPATKKLDKINKDLALTEPLPPLPHRNRSERQGAKTEIEFVNSLDHEIEVFWIKENWAAERVAKLTPSESKVVATYQGHAFVVCAPPLRDIIAFRAGKIPRQAVISPGSVESVKSGYPPKGPPTHESPDGRYHAFFKDHNLYIRPAGGGEAIPLSRDGNAEAWYEGFQWSPDSKKIFAQKRFKGEERHIHVIESTPKDQLQPQLHRFRYEKPGDKISFTKPHLFHVDPAKEIPVSDELFPNPWSIGDTQWDATGERLYFAYNQRGHEVMRLIAVDAETGKAESVINEECGTFFCYSNKYYLRIFHETDEAIWMSERDGWNHLYLIDTKSGKVKNRITKGNWTVREVEEVDPKTRTVRFWAGGIRANQDPYFRHYCKVDFSGKNLRILTEGDGDHSIQHSPDRRYFVDTYSKVDVPPIHELRDNENGKLICLLDKADHSELLKTGWTPPERFHAKGRDGKTDIYGVIYRPMNFDPKKSYPVIEEIYAGPTGASAPTKFSNFQTSIHPTLELGFMIVRIDGMGTNYRSKAFHDVCWKNLGDAGFPDRIAWMKAAAAKYPYMDVSRVGIFGISAGGQNAMRALIAHGDFYKVAVADSGCHDNRMDKIWWNEQWMGWPVGSHYEEQSNAVQAHRLNGKLMLIVGELDRNVDPCSTLQVVDALIKADKDFELLFMTNCGHGSAWHPYAMRKRMDFFVRHLHDVEPRREGPSKTALP